MSQTARNSPPKVPFGAGISIHSTNPPSQNKPKLSQAPHSTGQSNNIYPNLSKAGPFSYLISNQVNFVNSTRDYMRKVLNNSRRKKF